VTRLLVLIMSVVTLLGCASQGTIVAALNATAAAGDLWIDRVEARYAGELDAIVHSEAPLAERRVALAKLREDYRPVFGAWRAFRAAWLVAAAALEAGDEEGVLMALAQAKQAMAEAQRAAAALGGEVE